METGPSAPQSVRRLLRRDHDKVFGGVAGGLGDYFGVDPVWFRLGFVLTSFLGGAGVVAYLVLWAILPTTDGDAPTAASAGRQLERILGSIGATPAWVGALLVIFGALLVVIQILEWDAGAFWGVALIVGGVLLFRSPDSVPATPVSPAEPSPPHPPTPSTPPSVAGRTVAPPVPAFATPPRPRVPRPRSPLGWMTLGTVLVALGTAALLDLGGALAVYPGHYPALALAIVGAGLIIGSWWGRARWLIAPGVLLIPFVLVASLIAVPFTGGFGQRLFSPDDAAGVQPEYHLVAGEMVLDLGSAAPALDPVAVRATVVAGRLLVVVSRNVLLDVRARVGAGRIDLFGQTFHGVNVDVRRRFEPDPTATVAGTIRLDIETSLGVVEVRTP